MPNSIAKTVRIGDPTGATSQQYDIGSEAQNVIVSFDADGHIITDISQATVASTKPLTEVLRSNVGNYYGTCSTTSSTAAKAVTVSADQNFELKKGIMIAVAFTATNVAANPTLNVNNTGAKAIFRDTEVQTSGDAGILSGYTSYYLYNGTYWCWMSSGTSTGSGSGHEIKSNSGADMPQRTGLQFIGAHVTDDLNNNKTLVNIAKEMTQAQYDALTPAEKNDGTVRYITDAFNPSYSFVVLTLDQYNALTNPDPTTFYFCYIGE